MSDSDPPAIWSVSLLGNVAIESPDGQRIDLPGRYAEGLLASLCLTPGRPVERDVLAERLWPDLEPANKRTRLRQELLALRRLVGTEPEGGLLVLGRSGVAVAAERVATDLERFEHLVRTGGVEALREAIGLYRGELLERHDSLANGRRLEIAQRFEAALGELAEREAEAGRDDAARTLWLRLLERDALNLTAHAGLMRLFARQGQPGAVRRQWQQAQASWWETLQAEPPADLATLAQSLQRTGGVPPTPAPPLSPAPPQPDRPTPRRRPLWPWLGLAPILATAWLWRPAPRSAVPTRTDPLVWRYASTTDLPGEKPSSEARAIAVAGNGNALVVGLAETQREDVDALALLFYINRDIRGERKPESRVRYSGPGHDCDRLYSVVADTDDNFFAAGESFDPGAPGRPEGWRLLAVRIANGGKLAWAKTGPTLAPDGDHRIATVRDGADGAYVAATALVGKRRPLLVRYTRTGEILWSRTLEIEGGEATLGGLVSDADGNAYLCATVASPNHPRDWLVARYDRDGHLVWQRRIDGPIHGDDRAWSIRVDRWGGVFVGGVQEVAAGQRALALARFDPSGNFLGVSRDSRDATDLAPIDLVLADGDGRVALSGSYTDNDGASAAAIVVFDRQGGLRWSKAICAPAPYRSVGHAYLQLRGDGMLLMAAQFSRSAFTSLHEDGDLALLAFSPEGKVRAEHHYSTGKKIVDRVNALAYNPSLKTFFVVGQRIYQDNGQSAVQVLNFDRSVLGDDAKTNGR